LNNNWSFSASTCSCGCQHWIDAERNQTKANVKCVELNGPGYTFSEANCECFYTAPQKVQIFFRGCGNYLILDTDTNFPPSDYLPYPPFTAFPKGPAGGDGNQCNTIYNVDYELRRSSINPQVYFNIYPVPGASPYVIYIEGVDRRTACPERAFLQWTEENCARSNNNVDGVLTDLSVLYQITEPTMAKINLVGPLQASKFEIKFSTSDFCGFRPVFRIGAF